MVATIMFFFVGKALGPGGFLVGRGGGRRRGLFGATGEGVEELEFGYCFDVSIENITDLTAILIVCSRYLFELSSRSGCSYT